MHVHLRYLVAIAVCALASCADAPDDAPEASGPTGGSDPPTQVDLTCALDGSFSLSTDVVRPQPDGVHLLVVNEHEEPVSVAVRDEQGGGQGLGADPGRSELVLTQAPGNVELSCTPNSQLVSGEEPSPTMLMVVDTDGLYVDGNLACEMVTSMIADFTDPPIDEGPPPLDVAQEVIDGLRPDDILLYAGYPDQPRRAIVVSRDGEIVASFSIAKFEEQSWSITGYSACEGSGLPSTTG